MVCCMRMDKGPEEVLRALLFGTAEERVEAAAFQRESFRARFGCYPEGMEEITDPEELERLRQAG